MAAGRTIQLGILDFGAGFSAHRPRRVYNQTFESAMLAESLGYSRYWLAEHQSKGSAWASPELLLPLLAATTRRIKVGTAGILLRVYNPLKVASDFSLLSHLFPDRIDLGLVRGFPGDENARALIDLKTADELTDQFTRKATDLVAYLTDSVPETHPYSGATAIPSPPGTPEIWILGATRATAQLASSLGAAYGYSLFHSQSVNDPAIVQEYLSGFRPTGKLAEPKFIIAVAGVCAESESKAQEILGEYDNQFIKPTVVGTPSQCEAYLQELQSLYNATEFIFFDISKKYEDRLASYKLLAGLINP